MGSWKFKDWYGKNKDALSAKRRERYAVDAEYRKTIIERSAARRMNAKKEVKVGLSSTEVCTVMGISPWTLNRWKNAGYFPVESLRGYRFTNEQVALLDLYLQFFGTYPKRASALHKDKLDDLVQVVNHNWSA